MKTPRKNRNIAIIIVLITLLVLGGAAVGLYFLLKPKAQDFYTRSTKSNGQKNIPRAMVTIPRCVTDADCASTHTKCVDGICVVQIKPCNSDDDCNGGICHNKACLARIRPTHKECKADNECGVGHCQNNICLNAVNEYCDTWHDCHSTCCFNHVCLDKGYC